MKTNEIDFFERLRQQDHQAAKDFHKTMYPQVYAYVLKKGGTSQDAADHFQDTWLLFWQKIQLDQQFTFQGISKMQGFFMDLAKKRWVDRFRLKNAKIGQKSAQISESVFGLDEIWQEYELHDLRNWQKVLFDEIWQNLTEKCQILLRKRFFEELKTQEIAKAEGVNSQKISSDLKDCKEQFAKKIQKHQLFKEIK